MRFGVRRAHRGRAELPLPPVANVVLFEVGVAAALGVLAVTPSAWPTATAVVVGTACSAGLRWRGLWLAQWAALAVAHVSRSHRRVAETAAPAPDSAHPAVPVTGGVPAPVDPRVRVLRLLVGDLVMATAVDHEHTPVGLAWHRGGWTTSVLVDPTPKLVSVAGPPVLLPLRALAACLDERGVVLDAITVLWHSYPGGGSLTSEAPAAAAYREVLGPLTMVARRSTWVSVRLDPLRCPAAVRERGGGVAGAHRAVLGAVARVRGVLDGAAIASRSLDDQELLSAALRCAELTGAAGRGGTVGLRERWGAVTAGGVNHASYAVSGWDGGQGALDVLSGAGALSTTVALTLGGAARKDSAVSKDAAVSKDSAVSVQALVRLSARTPAQLRSSQGQLAECARTAGVVLTPMNGQQAGTLAGTLAIACPA